MAWSTSATPWGSFFSTLCDNLPRQSNSTRVLRNLRRWRDPLTGLLWLSAGLHALLILQHTTPSAEASATRSTAAASPDPLALAAVLTGLMVAVALVRRGSRSVPRFALDLLPARTHAPSSDVTAPASMPTPAGAIAAPLAAGGRPVLSERERLRSWSELSLHVSHEMRTPLNAVLGFTDVMHQELLGPVGHHRYREYLAHIRSSSEALLKATEDTLAVTQLLADPTPRESAVLGLYDCLTEARGRALRSERTIGVGSVEWTIDVAPQLTVEAAPTALRQALTNLFVAAGRHAGAGGRVAIRAAASHGAVALDIKVTPQAGTVRSSMSTVVSECPSGDERFPLSLARALLELQGAELAEARHGPALVLTTILTEAAQHDMALFD